jgi:ribose 5-phosphate isomerase B
MNATAWRIALASDHAGYAYKEQIKAYLIGKGYTIEDFGTDSDASVDYPLLIRPAAQAVARGDCDQGIVIGGSGNGEAMVANKVPGIRCAVCWSRQTAQLAREHNNANMISMGQRTITLETALDIVQTWLSATFEGGRHVRRLNQMAAQESEEKS